MIGMRVRVAYLRSWSQNELWAAELWARASKSSQRSNILDWFVEFEMHFYFTAAYPLANDGDSPNRVRATWPP